MSKNQSSSNTYTLFFSISILTDMVKFDHLVRKTGRPPLHDFSKINWDGLANAIRDRLIDSAPEMKKSVTVKLFDDSMEGATRGLQTEDQMFSYMKTLVGRSLEGNFKARDLRSNGWVTSYEKSAPAQVFHGTVVVQDDGSCDILEAVVNGMLKHFYMGGNMRFGGLSALPVIFSGQMNEESEFSDEMLSVFSDAFDHPFTNDVSLIVLNEAQQETFANAKSIQDVERLSSGTGF